MLNILTQPHITYLTERANMAEKDDFFITKFESAHCGSKFNEFQKELKLAF